MSDAIVYSKFDSSKLVVQSPKTNNGGISFVPVKYQTENGLREISIQCPRLTVYSPLKSWKNNNGDINKYTLGLSFKSTTKPTKSAKFEDFIESFETWAKGIIMDNSTEWTRSPERIPDGIMDDIYSSSISSYKSNVIFNVKVDVKDQQPSLVVVDENELCQSHEKLVSGVEVVPVIKCMGIWCYNGKWGTSWKATFVKYFE